VVPVETLVHKDSLDPLDPVVSLAETETPEELVNLAVLDTLATEVMPETPEPMVLPERVEWTEHQQSKKETLADPVTLDGDTPDVLEHRETLVCLVPLVPLVLMETPRLWDLDPLADLVILEKLDPLDPKVMLDLLDPLEALVILVSLEMDLMDDPVPPDTEVTLDVVDDLVTRVLAEMLVYLD